MTDLEQLRAENARLRRRLTDCIVWMDTREEAQPGMPRLCDMARAALSAYPEPVGDAWQSIDNITPDAGHVLLLGSTRHDARTIFTGWIAQNGMIYGDAWGLDCKPTHWMPLPKPPAGENGND